MPNIRPLVRSVGAAATTPAEVKPPASKPVAAPRVSPDTFEDPRSCVVPVKGGPGGGSDTVKIDDDGSTCQPPAPPEVIEA